MDASLLFSVLVIVVVTVLGSALIVRLTGEQEAAPPNQPSALPAPAAAASAPASHR